MISYSVTYMCIACNVSMMLYVFTTYNKGWSPTYMVYIASFTLWQGFTYDSVWAH